MPWLRLVQNGRVINIKVAIAPGVLAAQLPFFQPPIFAAHQQEPAFCFFLDFTPILARVSTGKVLCVMWHFNVSLDTHNIPAESTGCRTSNKGYCSMVEHWIPSESPVNNIAIQGISTVHVKSTELRRPIRQRVNHRASRVGSPQYFLGVSKLSTTEIIAMRASAATCPKQPRNLH